MEIPRILIIGDIHGCIDELRTLVEKFAPKESDRIIALGDVIDRGPNSKAVLEYIASHDNMISILGNHELKHIRCAEGIKTPSQSQKYTQDEFTPRGYEKAIEFLRSFPSYIKLDEGILLHGFWEPNIPLRNQSIDVLTGKSSERKSLEPDGRKWYTFYNGRIPLIVGHEDYSRNQEVFIYKQKGKIAIYGLDTSCYKGGFLTGLILPGFTTISVKAAKNYWGEKKGDLKPEFSWQRYQKAYDQNDDEEYE